jgi:hypothetical protein
MELLVEKDSVFQRCPPNFVKRVRSQSQKLSEHLRGGCRFQDISIPCFDLEVPDPLLPTIFNSEASLGISGLDWAQHDKIVAGSSRDILQPARTLDVSDVLFVCVLEYVEAPTS